MSRTPAVPATIFVDADNTLWDTNNVYANAQQKLLERVEAATNIAAATEDRLALIRQVDQEIAEHHHARLRYPPKLLVRALAAVLEGVTPKRAVRGVWRDPASISLPDNSVNEIERAFLLDLNSKPDLRAGVREGLEVLQKANCLVLVITEGTRAKTEEIAKLQSLDHLISRVIEGTKRAELYQRVLRLVRGPEQAFMVGDQLDRDIAPAKEAGLTTIYFPGEFQPRWTPEETVVQPDYRIRSFEELPVIVLNGATSRHLTSV